MQCFLNCDDRCNDDGASLDLNTYLVVKRCSYCELLLCFLARRVHPPGPQGRICRKGWSIETGRQDFGGWEHGPAPVQSLGCNEGNFALTPLNVPRL